MKQRVGFTIIEVMIALFIASTTLFALSELQLRSMLKVWQSREDIDRVYIVKKFLYRMYLNPDQIRKTSQKFDEPAMQMRIEPVAIHKKSSLAPYTKQLQFLHATATWSRGTATRTLHLYALTPRLQQESEAS
jgi:Tfp pilus assembly protein PilV